MLIELPAIGRDGLRARLAAHAQIALLLRSWHQSARTAEARLSELPPARYAAAVGAVHNLVFECVATGRASEAPALEQAVYDAVTALLELPAFPLV